MRSGLGEAASYSTTTTITTTITSETTMSLNTRHPSIRRNESTFSYLISPYTHEDPGMRGHRAELAAIAAAYLMQHEWPVFSPIAHGTTVARHMPASFSEPTSAAHAFWMRHCMAILGSADDVILLPIPGWRQSRGVLQELEFACGLGMPIYIMQDLPGPWGDELEQVMDFRFGDSLSPLLTSAIRIFTPMSEGN